MSGFKKVDGKNRQYDAPRELRIYADSNGAYLTAGAYRAWFDDAETLVYYVDREHSRLGINPGEDGAESFRVGDKKDNSYATIYVRTPLHELGVDVDAVEQTWAIPLSQDDESGFVVADMSDLVEAQTDAVHCPECGRRCANEQGLKNHANSHETTARDLLAEMDPDELGESIPDDPRRADGGDADV